MKEKIFDLIISILVNFKVSYKSWLELRKIIDSKYIKNNRMTTIKKETRY